MSLARDYNGRTVAGTATGVVNAGGFSAAILASLLVGGALDPAGRSGVPAYRVASGCAVAVRVSSREARHPAVIRHEVVGRGSRALTQSS